MPLCFKNLIVLLLVSAISFPSLYAGTKLDSLLNNFDLEELETRANAAKDYALLFEINIEKAIQARQSGQTEEAFHALLESKRIADDLQDVRLLAEIYLEIGDFYRLQHDYKKAILFFEKAINGYETFDPLAGNRCKSEFLLATTYKGLDDKKEQEKGIRMLEHFLLESDCSKTLSAYQKAKGLNNLGSAYVSLGAYKKGEEILLQALSIKEELDKPESLAYTQNELASLYTRTFDLDKAIFFAKAAYSNITPGKNIYLEHDIVRNLAHTHYNKEKEKEGFNYLLKLQEIKDSILNVDKANALAEMTSRYELERKDFELNQKSLLIAKQENSLNRYLILGLCLLIAVGSILIWLRWRLKKRQLESEKLQELDTMKTRFFTNITHEFRTPLAVIVNLLETEKDETVSLSKQETNIAHRNVFRLKNLIDQLLDLSKLEAGKMQLQVSEDDLGLFVKNITNAFDSLAKSKDIRLQFTNQLPQKKYSFDPDKIEKIITNLLSNALKFTPESGEVNVVMNKDADRICIRVKDNGPGIPPQEVNKIFERFQQVDQSDSRAFEGSGIGLALARELVRIHKGTIEVESEMGEGAVFQITIPAKKEAYLASELTIKPFSKIGNSNIPLITELETEASIANNMETKLATVLIAEDDADLRFLLKKQLSNAYKVLEAMDGKSALDLAIQEIPDLVISDVMMPEMDGYALCEALKANLVTNHIPVILLTAKAGQRDRLEGIGFGAEHFLVKPYEKTELLLLVSNLIEQRKKLQQKYARETIYKTVESPVTSRDDQFINELLRIIEDAISDEKFGVEELAQSIHMSRSQLYRKLKALINKSPNQFLREIRLTKAMELLQSNAGNVSEIAMMVGFSNANYFYKCFKDVYGKTPGEVLSQVRA